MFADIEALVLSGELFNGKSRSSSPTRSPSPDKDQGWHDEELELSTEEQKYKDQGYDSDSDAARQHALKVQHGKDTQPESIGMGPGRTGVKGVIRDRDEAAEIQKAKQAHEMDEVRKKMEASNLGGKTFLEEEREKAERGEKADELVIKEREKAIGDRQDLFGRKREGKFGHLREVGMTGYLNALENEAKGVWVVVHIYEPSLERCYMLDETLARLARSFPDTKFLRARASALGFAMTGPSAAPRRSTIPSRSMPTLDEDDPYAFDDKDDEEVYEDEGHLDGENVDLDMLPTMLVYRDGELVHNWVRVDWEAGQAGVEELLDQHHILPRYSGPGKKGNLGLPSDDEDDFDLIWSDEEDIGN